MPCRRAAAPPSDTGRGRPSAMAADRRPCRLGVSCSTQTASGQPKLTFQAAPGVPQRTPRDNCACRRRPSSMLVLSARRLLFAVMVATRCASSSSSLSRSG